MKIHSRNCSRHETELAEWQLRCRALEAEKRQARRGEGIRMDQRGKVGHRVSWDIRYNVRPPSDVCCLTKAPVTTVICVP